MTDAHDQEWPFSDEFTPFGGCPICGEGSSVYHIGRAQWMCCIRDRLKWKFGENILSGWKHMSDESFERAAQELADFDEVKGVCHASDILGVEYQKKILDQLQERHRRREDEQSAKPDEESSGPPFKDINFPLEDDAFPF